MRQERQPTSVRGNVQKSSSSKAAALLTHGAYSQYVSTAKGRERRWRLFSTFPPDVYGHLFEGDHQHVIDLLDNAQEQAEPSTPPQPALEVLKPFAYKQLENITN
jgi:hypothetical protein